MELTQEEIKGLANLRPLTRSTEIYEGMHIYTILKGRNGLNLLFDEVVLKPTDKDWKIWENSPDNKEKDKNRWKAEQEDQSYWAVAESDCINDDRSVLSEDEIYKMELTHPLDPDKVIVTWS